MNKDLQIHSDEEIFLKRRKHWFILLEAKAGALTIGIVPVLLAWWLLLTPNSPFFGVDASIVLYLSALWLLFIWMALATIWTNYYLDLWIVTNKRIVHVNQIGLFSREVATLRMERVQDVTVEQHGVIATLFGYGTIRVQSAGASADDTVMRGIARPAEVRRIMLEQVDMYTEEMNRVYRSAESRHNPHSE